MTTALLMIVASVGGAGFCLVIAGARRAPRDTVARSARDLAASRRRRRHGAAAAAAGLVAFMVTRWPVAIPLAALAVLGLRGLGGRPASHLIERLEAIASWTEMLRDTLAGAAGLTQALIATASICPQAIREQVQHRVHRSRAARAAARPRIPLDVPARLGDLLGALAESTREEVAMRQGVEASRSSARSAVRTVTGFSFGFLGLMALFARPYLAPYGTPDGQAVLAVVGALFGLGLWLMAVMVRTRPVPRLFVAEPTA